MRSGLCARAVRLRRVSVSVPVPLRLSSCPSSSARTCSGVSAPLVKASNPSWPSWGAYSDGHPSREGETVAPMARFDLTTGAYGDSSWSLLQRQRATPLGGATYYAGHVNKSRSGMQISNTAS